ncbi:MAG TPA: TolC family protein [Gemmatimonadaceae bacterium]|nr:TolC family protein [Gemmatimonadaceae bacterium]
MKLMWAALLLVPVALPGQTFVMESARPITLDEAVSLAHRNAPATVQARGIERTSRQQVNNAYAAFIPSVSVSAGGTRQFNDAGTIIRDGQTITLPSEPWSYSTGMTFGLELFDGGRRFYDLGAARASVDASEANYITQQFNVSLNVKQQYYNVLAARESESAALAQLEQAQQQLRAATARVTAGVATKSDSLRSLIQVGNAELALETARNDLRIANAALTRMVGTNELVTANPADTLGEMGPLVIDSTSLYSMAINGPVVTQAEANLGAARAARRAATTRYLPTINATYQRGGSGTDRFGFGNDSYNYSGALRLSLNFPLFNQLSREDAIVRASVSQDNAQAALRDSRLAAQQNLTQYRGGLLLAERRIQIQQASVEAAEEDLRVQQQRYALGASTLLDLLTSQTTLNQARAALIAARYDYRVAKAQLEALVGREL